MTGFDDALIEADILNKKIFRFCDIVDICSKNLKVSCYTSLYRGARKFQILTSATEPAEINFQVEAWDFTRNIMLLYVAVFLLILIKSGFQGPKLCTWVSLAEYKDIEEAVDSFLKWRKWRYILERKTEEEKGTFLQIKFDISKETEEEVNQTIIGQK